MAESRTKNAKRNVVFGVLYKAVTVFLPFITRTVMIKILGASLSGVGTLFTSILSFLSLAELGFGVAIVYTMYAPIAQNDTDKICALLNYYKGLYRKIGTVMLVIGTVLVPFVPLLIKGGAPEGTNVYILYYMYLLNSVVSYFFAGYKQSLLTANQRSDITNKIGIVVNISVQLLQILVLFLTSNFYIYAAVPIIGTLSINLFNSIITKKMYPECFCRGDIDRDTRLAIKKRVSGLIGTKLNSIVIHSFDTIVISAVLGSVVTTQYGNYHYIMNAICGFIMVLYSSLTAGLGNKIATDTTDHVYDLFKQLNFVNAWIVGFCSVCFACLFEPFIELWLGTEMLMGIEIAFAMAAYFFIYQIQRVVLTFKDAAGIWYEDRFRPYVSMTVNLVGNIVLVQFFGVIGVVLASILSFTISLPWANRVLFSGLFKMKSYKNLFSYLKYLAVTVVAIIPTYMLCSLCHGGILGLIERLLICTVVANLCFFILYCITGDFKYIKSFLLKYIFRKRRKL